MQVAQNAENISVQLQALSPSVNSDVCFTKTWGQKSVRVHVEPYPPNKCDRSSKCIWGAAQMGK